jgi:hypothetical protein
VATVAGSEVTVVPFSFLFTFGSPFTLTVIFSASANAAVTSETVQPLTTGFTFSQAESIYTNTAGWNGIQSIKSGSTVIADYFVTSVSGTSYVAAIPEPRAAYLLLAGLLAIGWRVRRQGLLAC